MTWYQKLGYATDPFSVGKGAQKKTVGLDAAVESLTYHVEAGNMVLVQGKQGTGKTSLLHAVIDRFKGERRVIYYDCTEQKVDIKKLMQRKYGVLGRVLNLTPKSMILLLDNFKDLSHRDVEMAKFYFDNNYLKAVVFSGNGEGQLPGSIRDRIGNRIIALRNLTEADAVILVKNRLGSTEFLPDRIVRKIFKKSGKNAKTFLERCSTACESAASAGAQAVSEEHIR